MKFSWCVVFLGLIYLIDGAKILTVVTTPAKSHHYLLKRLSVELAIRGHEVTILSSFKPEKAVPNVKEIILPDLNKQLAEIFQPDKNGSATMFEMRHMSKWFNVIFLPRVGPLIMENILSTNELQKLIKSNQKFDLILGEIFLNECLLAGLSHTFKAPLIGVAVYIPNFWINYMVGNPTPASYIPTPLVGFPSKMTFWQRLENSIFGFVEELMYRYVTLRDHDRVMRKFFGNDLPPIEDIIKNTSLVLLNHHSSLAFPRPSLPNIVEIGGYHMHPAKTLPFDIERYMNESKEGVILFSMGSLLESSKLPVSKKKSIISAFSKLKQNVLWKFEDETLTDLPGNVNIQKWIPQSDVLAHPNLKLFITHGGLSSTIEAVVRGVPMIGIPILGDQYINVKYNADAGFGLALDLDDLNEDVLYDAILEVLRNPKYQENVKRVSVLLQDNPLSAMVKAMYWIEYAIRHNGAPHLRSAGQDLEWYQLYLLDVLGFILIMFILVNWAALCIVKLLHKKLIKTVLKFDKSKLN